MLTNDAKRKLISTGMFALPIGVILVTGEMLGGPATTTAGPLAVASIDPATLSAPPPPTVDPVTAAALVRIDALRTETIEATPFYHPSRGEKIVPDVEVGDDPPPSFTVQMIMATVNGNVALIDGTKYSTGDRLGESEWTIVSISADSRSVTIEHEETGDVYSASVDFGGLD